MRAAADAVQGCVLTSGEPLAEGASKPDYYLREQLAGGGPTARQVHTLAAAAWRQRRLLPVLPVLFFVVLCRPLRSSAAECKVSVGSSPTCSNSWR